MRPRAAFDAAPDGQQQRHQTRWLYYRRVRWIDGHLDLAYLAANGRDLSQPCPKGGDGCVSLPALREAGVELTFATIFTEPARNGPKGPVTYRGSDDFDGAEAAGRRQLELYRQLEVQGELSIVHNGTDLETTRSGAAPKIVLLMEGADPIRSPEHVRSWFDDGLRIVGLTWHMGTRYAGGNGRPGPLTPLGVELVRALDEVGIVHDASHLADAALEGVLEHARGPIIATHSNCRALVEDNQRHLRDDHIQAIGRRDGVVGLNLFSGFLTTDGRATIARCVDHVQRVAQLMGRRSGIALGSDMDGGFTPEALPQGLDHPTKLDRLAEALRNTGWSDEDVSGFCFANWRRFLEEVLP